MKSSLRSRRGFLVALIGLFGAAAVVGRAQNPSLYFVNKVQNFVQTSSAGPVADPSTPFDISVQAPSNVTFTLPAGNTLPLAFSADNQDYEINQSFASKTALDAAFPSGTYKMTATGIPTLSLNMGTDLYPSVTPQVTSGTWNAGGLLVVDPTVANTVNFNTFTGYATTGVAGHMQTKVQGLFDNVKIGGDGGGIISVPNTLGLTVQTTPLTSISIPARTLTSGRVYQVSIQFDTAATFDTTTVSGGGVVALFSKSLNFYIAAQAPGTTTPIPVIIGQPTNQTGVLGGSATFSLGVTVGGVAPTGNLQILWFFNGQQLNLDGSKYGTGINNNPGLTIKNLTAADVGNYSFTLINAAGIVTSNSATLTLAASAGPAITRQPTSVTVTQGSTATFSVVATGTPTPTYQWRLNGQNVPLNTTGGTGPTISLPGAQASVAGTYTCVVTNASGSVTSSPANLAIATNFNDPGRLTNLSVLTDITAAVPSFTLGTVVGGAGTSGTKPLVIRAVGPSLGALGVGGTIADPKVDLLTGQTVALTNDNWGGDPNILAAMASVGAFGFASATSKDAAIFGQGLASRDYTVQVSGVGGATGTVIAEIYDATPAGTFNASTPRLINVSVLKNINTGGSITLGFTVGGTSAKTILIRAIGPGLAAITGTTNGTVPDPQLTLFDKTSTAIATNNDWGNDVAISVVGNRVNAFSVGNSTKDAMLLMTLPAGGYTAQASGVGGTGGLVIVEAYEVP